MIEKVQPVLNDVLIELLKDKPDDPIPIILQVLETKSGNEVLPLNRKEEVELMHLRNRWKNIQEKRKEMRTQISITVEEVKEETKKAKKKPQDTDSDSSSSSDSDDNDTFSRGDLLRVKNVSAKAVRSSVSAEVLGLFNRSIDFKPTVIPKDDDTRFRIKHRLKESFMFKNLEDKEMDIVVDAMKEMKFKEGETIIKQGDKGDELYVLESGECSCFKVFSGDKIEKKLRDYIPGEAFGELALLYNAPRAASIKASDDCTLFALDRNTFNAIVKNSARKNREMYEDFLKSVELLKSMDYYERVSLSDALKKIKYKKDEFIIKEGDPGDCFYFVLEGKAVAQKEIGGKLQNLMEYQEGDYFGERALLTNEPRAASILCTSKEIVLAKLENRSFKRLLGPVEDILKRNMMNYFKYQADRVN